MKASKVLKNIVVCLLLVIALLMMVFTIISSRFDSVDRNIFGYKAFIVRSDSMSATDFSAGDLILVKEVDPRTLEVDDIISYQSIDSFNYGEIVTHKIRSVNQDVNGNPTFVTYGTTTNVDDESVVTYDMIVGKYQMSLPAVGSFFAFLKTTPGYILCIFLPFALLILSQATTSIKLFRQYRQEKLDEIKRERELEQEKIAKEKAKLEKEREETKKMMEELLKLKGELSKVNEDTKES